ncbi:MAG: tetratricopeptide repeat protein [Phycisphaerales bacterium]|nr:tetratricopeptide repeat protein [Phycisphaerales bacterium]
MSKQYYLPHAIESLLIAGIYFLAACGDQKPTPPPTPTASQVQASVQAMDRLIDAGQLENALRVARELTVMAPSDPLASEALARALLSQSNANPTSELKIETAAAYAKAAAARPSSPGLQSAAGITAYSAGNIESAISFHQNARQLEPGNPQHLYHEAMMWNAMAQPASAVELFEKALQLDPDSPNIEIGFAEALAQLGNTERSLDHMQRARKLALSDSLIRFRAAALLRVLGKPNDAAEMLLGGVSMGSADQATCELCAHCLSDAGQFAQSAEVWERLATMTMMRPTPLLEAARNWSKAGQQESALICLEKARQAIAPKAYFEVVQSEILARQPRQP